MASAPRHIEPVETARIQGPIIKEVILENFMSYEYGRIPLKSGLNLICGPNGAGKSTILLGISVALGQSYTERSRKLSDLVRRGKDIARVSLMLDNTPRNGRRPIRFSRSDTFMLSRYIRSDGSYWFEADYHEISKAEVERILSEFGLIPDNRILIMHQGMVEEFLVTPPEEKLKMVEDAIGIGEYRQNILLASSKLSALVTEERELQHLLESASNTLEYWKSMHDKLQGRQDLANKKDYCQRELLWAHYIKLENALKSSNERLESREKVLKDIETRMERAAEACEKLSSERTAFQVQLKRLYYTLMRIEKEKAAGEALGKEGKRVQDILRKLNDTISSGNEGIIKAIPDVNLVRMVSGLLNTALDNLRNLGEETERRSAETSRRRKDLDEEAKNIEAEIGRTEEKLTTTSEKYINTRVDEAVLSFRKRNLWDEITDLKRSISDIEKDLAESRADVERSQPRIETKRNIYDIQSDLKFVEAQLAALGPIPEDAEKFYSNYLNDYEVLKSRIGLVDENKKRALEELDVRKNLWRSALKKLLEEVSPTYQQILSRINATGMLRFLENEDIEESGLEITVGFMGNAPTVLDAYTQSGGERSVAVMAFLLSLQNRVLSPFRAVDEFDIHMDPANREAVFKMILSYVKNNSNTQYIVITPSQLYVIGSDLNIIMVQKTAGGSNVSRGS